MVFCSKCGTEYPKKKKFCPKCGAKFKEKSKTKLYITSIGIILIVFITAIIFISKSNIPQIVGLNEKLANLGVNTENLGFSSDKEVSSGSTLEETSYCGDGVCVEDENCKTCIKDCGDCRIIERKQESYCGDRTCDPGECRSRCTSDCTVNDCQDGICDLGMGEACDNSPDCRCNPGTRCEQKRCITFCGNRFCENDEKTCDVNRCIEDCGICACKEDLSGFFCKKNEICQTNYDLRAQDTNQCCTSVCIDNPNLYPLIFVHGHSSKQDTSLDSINNFLNFQNRFDSDGVYINMGYIIASSDINAISVDEWGKFNKPISVRTTYYLDSITPIGGPVGDNDNQRIDTYAKRLKIVVDTVLHHTGAKKVKIVAHSMGGLVTRQYIRFHGGDKVVERVMIIGTPNHGIHGLIEDFCDGINQDRVECQEMQAGSNFLNSLNSGDETYGDIKYATITGIIDADGKEEIVKPCGYYTNRHDEVVCADSVPLAGSFVSYTVTGSRISGQDTFHNDMISPNKVSKVYQLTKDFLIE